MERIAKRNESAQSTNLMETLWIIGISVFLSVVVTLAIVASQAGDVLQRTDELFESVNGVILNFNELIDDLQLIVPAIVDAILGIDASLDHIEEQIDFLIVVLLVIIAILLSRPGLSDEQRQRLHALSDRLKRMQSSLTQKHLTTQRHASQQQLINVRRLVCSLQKLRTQSALLIRRVGLRRAIVKRAAIEQSLECPSL